VGRVQRAANDVGRHGVGDGRFGVVSEWYGVVGCEAARRKLKRSWVEVVAG
jgi:hypothetical protein